MKPELKTLLRPQIIEALCKLYSECRTDYSGSATEHFLLTLAKLTDEKLLKIYVDVLRNGFEHTFGSEK